MCIIQQLPRVQILVVKNVSKILFHIVRIAILNAIFDHLSLPPWRFAIYRLVTHKCILQQFRHVVRKLSQINIQSSVITMQPLSSVGNMTSVIVTADIQSPPVPNDVGLYFEYSTFV